MALPGKIKKLDQVVVNRIAAGEIIQKPANALKELIENSLDAKASDIQITIKDGGLKLLQRFTTSKLSSFADLHSLSTYGFRGEALASISHVAQLTITTKTAQDKVAHRASYVDGKLKAPPKALAGNQGTTITIENLFYNVPQRRKALDNISEQFTGITEVVTRYAVHNSSVAFTLKKQGENSPYVRTPSKSDKSDTIKLLFGQAVARELIEVSLEDSVYKFKLQALITNPNYSNKKLVFLLFINHRLVESTLIKKMLDDLYSIYLPKKTHPWCYISLEIDPNNVDVNVHPTKSQVKFLHEEAIVERVKEALDGKLSSNNASRTFYAQARLPQVDLSREALGQVLPDLAAGVNENKDKGKVQASKMVRTDHQAQKLEKFNFTRALKTVQKLFGSQEPTREAKTKEPPPENQIIELKITSVPPEIPETLQEQTPEFSEPVPEQTSECTDLESVEEEKESDEIFKSYSVNCYRRPVELTSILRLRKRVEDSYHGGLRKILSGMIFIGCVDEKLVLFQSDVDLYICKIKNLAEEIFYEIMLYDFANYGVLKFSSALSLVELAKLGMKKKSSKSSLEQFAEQIKDLLVSKSEMLKEYFAIVITKNGYIKSLPVLLEDYSPDVAGELPNFVVRLATKVDWTEEQKCFEDISRETARFYSNVDFNKDWRHSIEYVLFPAIKESLLPPKEFAHDSSILKIASLPDLYKVFERC
ncbi:Similar to Mlh1: DNA mismatch repair protein Mlh1 (Mus musculus) [Cotesia congregata]|uniref:Similar to Mlh1: DNA mismatch repair protein Mlh1 (Mus musculus) n=1 Tax=Cotesia congregata TaxID=51543 RepID=A0A8J2EKN5_COTCN|nr:Similar to Mlh1: DNA mismatch repair protein Mlh1 (Mus musculus) [Cotesia congregata]